MLGFAGFRRGLMAIAVLISDKVYITKVIGKIIFQTI